VDWVTPLPKFLYAINNSVNRSIGVKPSSINAKNASELWERIYGKDLETTKPRLKVGDAVRITKPKHIFEKGYFPSRSDHIYSVDQAIGMDPEYYKLKKDSGEAVKRRFYLPELVKTQKNEETTYRIEKVLGQRTKGGIKELKVKFIDYPEIHWIKESDLVE
jgi:hypothetical protein